jgi:predicted nucleic acid-binding protein
VHEFFAIAGHPKIYDTPTPPARALDQIDAWLQRPSVVRLAESTAHWPALWSWPSKARSLGPAVHDARIAVLCLQRGVRELWSADRDFRRFAALQVVNRLV